MTMTLRSMGLHILPISVLLAGAVGCQHPQQCPPAVSSTPPSLTSSPLPPPSAPPPMSHAHPPPGDRQHVWRLDFVLTPKDAKDATLTPTTFTVNLPEHSSGEMMVGKNVPLQTNAPFPPTSGGNAPPFHAGGVARQDVGLKVKAHIQPFPGGADDFLLDVDLELSAVEGGSGAPVATIRKITSHGSAVAVAGKSTLIVSLDEDKRHYELTVTPTKLR